MNILFEKNLGHTTQKNVVLGPEKLLLGPIFRRLEVFWGLKQRFLSDKTQIFFKKSVHKGLNYICEFFGKDLTIISVFK